MHQPAAALNWAIGDYVMESVIRAGGRSTVYTARRRGATDLRALKVIAVGTDPAARTIVDAERRGAELQQEFARHHGLVPWIEEIGETSSCLYVAMEFVPGEDLLDILARGPIPSPRALDLAIALATFLEKTHRFEVPGRAPERIIHADLKPGNIRVRPDGRLCVLDFGIAKAMAERSLETTQKWGTRQYMSPEWLQTGSIDEQVDYWSLGVLLYEMLAGHRPFRRFERHDNQLEDAIRRRERPEALPPHIDVALQQVVARLLASDIRQRYPTAGHVRAALEACRTTRPIVDIPTLPASPREDVLTEQVSTGDTPRTEAVPADSPPTEAWSPEAERASVLAAPAVVEAFRSMAPLNSPATEPAPIAAPALPGDALASPDSRAAAAVVRTRRQLRRAVTTSLWLGLAAIFASEGIGCIASERLRSDAAVAADGELEAAVTRRAQLAGWTLFDTALHTRVDPVLRDRLVGLADIVIADYRQDQPTVGRAEWDQARAWLTHAVSLYPMDRRLRAKLRYTEGHLQRLVGLQRAGAGASMAKAARQSYYTAIQKFREAADLDKQWADPYLGIAHTAVYGLGEVDSAVDALNDAEKRGYRLKSRERAQLGDAYRTRGERIWRSARDLEGDQQRDALARAQQDFKRCVEYFTPIVEFASSADQLQRCEARLASIDEQKTPWWRRLLDSHPEIDFTPPPSPSTPQRPASPR